MRTWPAFGLFSAVLSLTAAAAEPNPLDSYNVVWTAQSEDSGGSMPCGGGDVGCNVWVQDGDMLFYVSRSGTFDENNTMLKLGRVRLKLMPNPFDKDFRQELKLKQGCVEISGNAGGAVRIRIWVEVFRPVIHVDVQSDEPVSVEADYENWRTADRQLSKAERMACTDFLETTPEQFKVVTRADRFEQGESEVLWHHRNDNSDLVFDKIVTQQHMGSVRERLWNPQKDLAFGGLMRGDEMYFKGKSEGKYLGVEFGAWRLASEAPAKEHRLKIFLHTAQSPTLDEWKRGLRRLADAASPSDSEAWRKNAAWWRDFWDRSHIYCRSKRDGSPPESDPVWRIGRDYQLFRYMLGCNAYGEYPSKFNGSLFTFDGPAGTTPDFRFWGGGSFTAQNQRLVYWPMLKSGDFDMMTPQFELYRRALRNAELRTEVYWGHAGASFTEHHPSFGLAIGRVYDPNWGKYGLQPRPGDDPGRLLNPWCEDQYDTVLEFCLMILDVQRFSGRDVSKYLPLIESCVAFFDEHYQYQNLKRTGGRFDEEGHLVIYPGTACETYKLAVNPTPTVAGLRTVLSRMFELPEEYASAERRKKWAAMLDRVPPLSYREMAGRKTIAPAKSWQRINNLEFPQLYPVFPYGIYGLGKPDLQTAVDTWRFGADKPGQKRNFCWYQSGIFCARLGLTEESAKLLLERYGQHSRRFPALWDNRVFCECPDVDHGGVAMIHLQESLLQSDGRTIRLLPAWPKDWDVDFKLHAPYNTVVRCKFSDGEMTELAVEPESRAADVARPELDSTTKGTRP
ncbi:MAG: hypothetical protein JW959_10710 [Pirellulales bacterium]|nr:hypothetical protein [Pirellulales bacterium]